jgi:DNA-binding transcriptional ArsR family regulator
VGGVMGPELEFPPRDEIQLVDVLHAFADPVRLELMHLLDEADGAVACGQIPLPVGKATASHHLKVLREAGIVWAREVGTRRYYSLRRDDLEARFPGLLGSVLHSMPLAGAGTGADPPVSRRRV